MDTPNIVTHDGSAHADDLMCGALLGVLHYGHLTTDIPDFITRTRDKSVITAAQFCFDVGGYYSPEKNVYDHHFNQSPAREDGTPYSSIGLLWKHFGPTLLTRHTKPKDVRERDYLHGWVDQHLVVPLDLADLGLSRTPSQHSISMLLAAINPTWEEMAGLSPAQYTKIANERYHLTVRWLAPAFRAFLNELKQCPTKALEAFIAMVEQQTEPFVFASNKSLETAVDILRAKVSQSEGEILHIENAAYPWEVILPTLPAAARLNFVTYTTPTGQWRCQTVPTESNGFIPRKALPKAWWGLREEELELATGIPGAVFCHPAGFLLAAANADSLNQLLVKARAS